MSAPFVMSYVLLWVVVVLQGMLLLGTVRAIHDLKQGGHGEAADVEEPAAERLVGEEVPGFSALDISGAAFESQQLKGRSTVVLFASPNCPTCVLALEELSTVGRKAKGNVVVVCGAGADSCRRLADDFGLTVPVIVDEDNRLRQLFDVAIAPTAVLLNPNGRVVSYGHRSGTEELEEMLRNGDATAAGVS